MREDTADTRGNGRLWLSTRLRVLLAALVAVLAVGVALPGMVQASPENPQYDEWDFLNLINRDRRAHGLRPLAMIEGARDVARSWSAAMASRNQLAHNPDYATQLASRYPNYRRLAENVGAGGGVTSLHDAFMKSTGHRANVLGDYGYAGVGVTWAGTRLWVTVNFVKDAGQLPFIVRTPISRVGGAGDPDTAVLLSRRLAAGSAKAVVVARTDGFADALAGGPLATAYRGPVLLTPPNDVPANVIDEARRVMAPGGTVFVLGGPAAISAAMEAEFVSAGMAVRRLAGADRFATAAAIAPEVNPTPNEAFLVSGASFPDAVLAGAPAGHRRSPILLVGPSSVPPATDAYLKAHSSLPRVLVGGPAVVSDAVAKSTGVSERVAGPDRYSTSAAVSEKYFPGGNRVALASGLRFQDALLASAEAGRDGYPVVLSASPVPNPSYDYVARQANRWVFGLVVGRPSDISDDTVVLSFS
ncbi:MAG: cell wall-binding repeat-containing protein [Actinobacteria bacterium]|nr:cell wall-binding repeat-containing protein [Actinomycetota bacterium]